jgi:hypothetical protein
MSELIPISETASFDLIMRQAEVLADSTIIPSAYRRKAADIVAAGLAGRAYGWDVMTSMRQFHVIEGSASLRPESMLGLVRQAGHSVTVETGETGAVAHGKRADTEDTHSASFTMQDAEVAGLANKKNWKQYQDAMLTWRAVSKLCRVLFPDVVLGAGYVPEELGGVVTETGDLVQDAIVVAEEDDIIPLAEGKHIILNAVGGDVEEAKAVWETEFSDEEKISRSSINSLLDRLSSIA